MNTLHSLHDAPPPAPARGRIVAVVGAKGGVGTTQLAVNLAAEAALGGQTLLVDADFGKGDVAGYLDLKPEFTISELLERIASLDRDMLLGHVTRHRSGLHVLAQPYDLTDLAPPVPAELRHLLSQAASVYDTVVVDLGSQVDLNGVAGVAEADLMLLVATPKVPDLRDALRTLAMWRGLGAGPQKVRVLINRGHHRHAVPSEEIARLLGGEIFANIARDPDTFGRAAHDGVLLRELRPRSSGAQDIRLLWASVQAALSELDAVLRRAA